MEERSQHLFYHPQCRQSYWCLCHHSALARLEPQLEDRNRERESHGAKGGEEGLRKRAIMFYINWGDQKIQTWSYRYLNLKCTFKKLFTFFPGENSVPTLASKLSAGWREADTTAFPVQCSHCAPHTHSAFHQQRLNACPLLAGAAVH